MGCSQSQHAITQNQFPNIPSPSAKEEQIKLAFKAKRKKNVFTQSMDPDVRRTFHAKSYPKTAAQQAIIRT